MDTRLRIKACVVVNLLASALACGGVADLGSNGSAGGTGSGGYSTMSFGGSTGGALGADTGGTPSASGGVTGGAASVGGQASTGGERAIPPDEACVAAVLAKNACLACHGTATAAAIGAGLVLEGSNLGARLSATSASYKSVSSNVASCVAGALIIDAESPAESVLLKKVTGTQACGDAMPPGSGLSGSDLSCIQNWIYEF